MTLGSIGATFNLSFQVWHKVDSGGVAGAQCDRAAELFEQMQQQGCVPDVVTFTALISAYEKGGQWRRALTAYELMRQQRCKPDAIVYNAIIDALWETGVIWAQRKALTLYQVKPAARCAR